MTITAICLAGPTGSGKTALALELAAAIDGEIVNADSRQVYAELPIITAQPNAAELAQARHHLYGFLPCDAKISAGQWREMALAKCREIIFRSHVPILVGGTGFYFEAFLRGLAPMPDIPPEIEREMARRMEAEGPEKLHGELAAIDPAYAAKIHCHDKQRIRRALEVYAASGKTFSWWHAQGRGGAEATGPLLVLTSSLDWLAPRLAARIDKMLAAGALEEAVKAREMYGETGVPAFNGIGAKELMEYLAGKINREECRALWLASTRAYAKRQLTWFRGRKEAVWIEPDNAAQALQIAMNFIYFP